MNKYVRLDEVRHAVLHNEGQAVIAAIDHLKTFEPHGIMREMLIDAQIDSELRRRRTNSAELIKALRRCGKGGDIAERCLPCDYYDREPWCEAALVNDAADALEAADKRIVELEAQMPKRGEWIEKWRFKTDGTPFHKIGDMECSVCHGDMLGRYYSKYCPHCGAILRGEHDADS